MALIDLKSDLSFYGKKASGPYTPNRDKTDTKFSDDGLSVSVTGYDEKDNVFTFRNARAADSFLIDDVTYSGRGLASRKAQLGAGSKFPIGPAGERHIFDKVRTGFTADSKYSDQYGVKFGDSGLADTYTANSPIDDMYNKFNLRDDATPNPGYAKQPFILRGIQREGSSDPQRWGLGDTTAGKISSTIDLPRAGILTAGERSAIDAARIGKFLISPRGIGFLARQFGYQLMNPNIENAEGTAKGLPATQIYNPLSAPGQALVGGLLGSGKFTRHTNFASLPFGGGGKYGTIKLAQKAANEIAGPSVGRMIKLYGEYEKGTRGEWKTLTGPKGPGSILGIGITSHTRTTTTDLDSQRGILGGLPTAIPPLLESLFRDSGASAYDLSFGNKFNRWSANTKDESNNEYKDYPFNNSELSGTNSTVVNNPGESVSMGEYKALAYGSLPKKDDRTLSKSPVVIDFRKLRDGKTLEQSAYALEENRKSNFGNTLQLIETIDTSDDDSIIDFSFNDIAFKAYLGTLSDNFAPGWEGTPDHGRADPRYQYTSFERTISFDFRVIVEKGKKGKSGFESIWQKLQQLAQLTHPIYGDEGFYSKAVTVTIGRLFNRKQMIITDLGYDWDTETPWEIDVNYQAPMYTNIAMTCTVLGDRPQANSKIYGIQGL